MFPSKRVLVVYPDDYEELAIALQHEMSKLDGFDSAAWSVEHYQQNLPTLSARSHVIFLGDGEENRYSKIYLSQISNIVNIKGSCFGRDGSKAVIYGEGKLEQKVPFEAFARELGYGEARGEESAGFLSGVGSSNGSDVGRNFLAALVPGGLLGIGYWQISQYFARSNLEQKLRYEQTKLAIYNFVLTELEPWLETGA